MNTKLPVFIFLLMSIVVSTTLTSCSSLSGSYVEKKGVNTSIQGLIKAFDRSTNGLRGKSPNGRELVSRYQKPGSSSFDNAGAEKVRAYSRLRILGDRRPYTLQVQYVIEERNSAEGYTTKGYDEAAARQVLKKVLEFLVNRPDREDFIDDFKAF
ncbi:MAG: hypothetical protein IT287_02225 [Bdellovibrionaceae bacterium]|nr:hypothetical protein [Pseudobdellovibrionaceae bacterium]